MSVQSLTPGQGEGPSVFTWPRVQAVIEKEWAEVTKNKMILWSMALIPILLVGMILATDYFMLRVPAEEQEDDISELPIPEQLSHLLPYEAFIIQMNEQFMFYLFIIPTMLPVYIAAYSIIGEKQTKTLEPLLATPISTWELLVGKSVVATAPAVVLTWMSYIVTLVGLRLIASPTVFLYSVRSVWILAMLLFSPLLAFLSVLCGVIISSRINDPHRAADYRGTRRADHGREHGCAGRMGLCQPPSGSVRDDGNRSSGSARALLCGQAFPARDHLDSLEVNHLSGTSPA